MLLIDKTAYKGVKPSVGCCFKRIVVLAVLCGKFGSAAFSNVNDIETSSSRLMIKLDGAISEFTDFDDIHIPILSDMYGDYPVAYCFYGKNVFLNTISLIESDISSTVNYVTLNTDDFDINYVNIFKDGQTLPGVSVVANKRINVTYQNSTLIATYNHLPSDADCVGLYSWAMDIACDADETTDFCSSGFREYIAGLHQWSGNAEAYWMTNDLDRVGNMAMITLYMAKNENDDNQCFIGQGLLIGNTYNVNVNEVVNEEIKFQGTGELYFAQTI